MSGRSVYYGHWALQLWEGGELAHELFWPVTAQGPSHNPTMMSRARAVAEWWTSR